MELVDEVEEVVLVDGVEDVDDAEVVEAPPVPLFDALVLELLDADEAPPVVVPLAPEEVVAPDEEDALVAPPAPEWPWLPLPHAGTTTPGTRRRTARATIPGRRARWIGATGLIFDDASHHRHREPSVHAR